jgi:hypothetical protein
MANSVVIPYNKLTHIMKKHLLSFLTVAFLSVPFSVFSQEPTIVDSNDIPGGLTKTEAIKLTGTWNTDNFQELAQGIGTTGFGATNSKLKSVDMSEALIEEGTDLLVSGGFSSNGVFVNCKALTTVIMPAPEEAAKFDNLTKAFMNCSSLETIDLSGCTSITSLNNTFFNCSSLKEINIASNSLTKSSSMANTFENCSALGAVTLPSTITFASKTFANCTALTDIDWTSYEGTEAPVFYYDMFEGISDLKTITLTVDKNCVDLFTADENWSKLNIQEYNMSSVENIVDNHVYISGNQLYTASPISNVSVFSVSGNKVMSYETVENTLSLAGLQPGIYVAVYKKGNASYAYKFTVR